MILTKARTLSMTFGRPAAIPDNYVRLELPLDYEHIDLVENEKKKNSTLFYSMTMYACSILGLLPLTPSVRSTK